MAMMRIRRGRMAQWLWSIHLFPISSKEMVKLSAQSGSKLPKSFFVTINKTSPTTTTNLSIASASSSFPTWSSQSIANRSNRPHPLKDLTKWLSSPFRSQLKSQSPNRHQCRRVAPCCTVMLPSWSPNSAFTLGKPNVLLSTIQPDLV